MSVHRRRVGDVRVLITGANRGIGFAITGGLLARGHQVVLTAREENRGRQARSRLSDEHPDARTQLGLLDVSRPGHPVLGAGAATVVRRRSTPSNTNRWRSCPCSSGASGR
ncbi:MAG: SDR family NAD(P)-dependent oxidoreductase [Microlunatus sp.]|nr:SDR family NAD(P)-dependent oxidoreductase [Microlunatus sp.]MDN5769723.1 SDR family NAD(P)-dependent oxidoreductase [Microlunatus sp.]